MRHTHPAGEKLFVDYAGDTVPVFDQITNAERPAHIFVAALGASNYTYAEARWSEGLSNNAAERELRGIALGRNTNPRDS
jgi:transposase